MSLVFTTEWDKPTTEWEDAQRRIGNLPPLEREAAPAEANDGAPPFAAAVAAMAEDGDVDELARIRAERLEELKAATSRGCFGKVVPLMKVDYVAEVNEAGGGVGVVVFLHKPRHYLSSLMLVLLEKLAIRFSDVKFLQIDSHECIPNYPEANLPTLLMYKDDDLVHQCVGAAAFGGSSFGVDDVEWELAQAGLVTTDLPKNPHQARSK
jgi:hypothetical protein